MFDPKDCWVRREVKTARRTLAIIERMDGLCGVIEVQRGKEVTLYLGTDEAGGGAQGTTNLAHAPALVNHWRTRRAANQRLLRLAKQDKEET